MCVCVCVCVCVCFHGALPYTYFFMCIYFYWSKQSPTIFSCVYTSNNEKQNEPTPVFEEVLSRLDSQNVVGESLSLRGNPLICKGRQRETKNGKRLFAMCGWSRRIVITMRRQCERTETMMIAGTGKYLFVVNETRTDTGKQLFVY